jgi:hypothetical protein
LDVDKDAIAAFNNINNQRRSLFLSEQRESDRPNYNPQSGRFSYDTNVTKQSNSEKPDLQSPTDSVVHRPATPEYATAHCCAVSSPQ